MEKQIERIELLCNGYVFIETYPNLNNKSSSLNPKYLYLFDIPSNNSILNYIPKQFTLATKQGSYQFNILLLSETSTVINNFIKNNPSILLYNLDIEDEMNVLGKIEQLYLGKVVSFSKTELPTLTNIGIALKIVDFAKIGQNEFNPNEKFVFSKIELLRIFSNQKLETFTLTIGSKNYKCNKYGIYISEAIRDFLSKNENSDQFLCDFADDLDDIQPIIDFFNFKMVNINSDNMNIIKKFAENLQFTGFIEIINEFIDKNDELSQFIDDQMPIFESIEEFFDLLLNINEINIESAKKKILESYKITEEDDIRELAAIFLQVIKANYLLYPKLIDLLIELGKEQNKSNYYNELLPFIINKSFELFNASRPSRSFFDKLLERGILTIDQIKEKIYNYSLINESGEPKDQIENALFHDDVDTFQYIVSNLNINIEKCKVRHDIFNYYVSEEKMNYINYAAAYGSIKCFKYLILNHAQVDLDTFRFALWGENIEIIKIASQNCTKSNDFFVELLEPTIIKHRNDLFVWILDQIMPNEFDSKSANLILSLCAESGNVFSFLEIFDKVSKFIYDYIYFVQKAASNGFYKLACFIWNIYNHKSDEIYFDLNNNQRYSKDFYFSFVHFNNLSIFKLFLEIVKNQKNIRKCLKCAVENDCFILVKYFFNEYMNETFKLSKNFAFHLLKASIITKSSMTSYLINTFLNLKQDVFKKPFDFEPLIMQACKNRDFELVKILTNLAVKYDKKHNYTQEFQEALELNCFEICKYFIDNDLFVNFNDIAWKNYEIADKDLFLPILNKSDDETKSSLISKFLSIAISKNNIELTECFFEKNAKCNFDDLFNAIKKENLDLVKLIIKYNNSPCFINQIKKKTTALHTAIQTNNIEIVKYLLSIPEINVNLNACVISDDLKNLLYLFLAEFGSPLSISISLQHREIAKILIQDRRTNVNLCNHLGLTPLFLAVKNENDDIVDLLIKNPGFNEEDSLLNKSFYISKKESITKKLYSLKSIDVNYYEKDDDETTLTKALKDKNDEKIDLIIHHPLFDKKQSQIIKAIMISISNDDIENFRKLIEIINNNVNIVVKEQNKYPLFCFTLIQKRYLFANEILENSHFNPDKNTIQDAFEQIIFSLKEDFPFNLLRKLVEFDEKHDHFIDFSNFLSNGKSVFTSLGFNDGIDEIVQFFIEHGADPNIKDTNGNDPLKYAIELNSLPLVVSLINSNKVDLTKKILCQKTGVNKTYLHLAARLKSPEILIELLKCKKIDVNAVDDKGETSLMESCRFMRIKNIEALFQIDELDYLHINNNGENALKIISGNSKIKLDMEEKSKDNYYKMLINCAMSLKNETISNEFNDYSEDEEYFNIFSSDKFDDVD